MVFDDLEMSSDPSGLGEVALLFALIIFFGSSLGNFIGDFFSIQQSRFLIAAISGRHWAWTPLILVIDFYLTYWISISFFLLALPLLGSFDYDDWIVFFNPFSTGSDGESVSIFESLFPFSPHHL